jgi:hypothetical protein
MLGLENHHTIAAGRTYVLLVKAKTICRGKSIIQTRKGA